MAALAGDAYKSIAEALTHGGMANRVKVNIEWVDAELFDREDPAPHLEPYDAILVPGGFGERGTEGKIKAGQFARERKIPYLGMEHHRLVPPTAFADPLRQGRGNAWFRFRTRPRGVRGVLVEGWTSIRN